jgi:hypothetical protein
MLELDRPLPAGERRRNRVVQKAFALHPQVRGGHRRLTEVDTAVNAGA